MEILFGWAAFALVVICCIIYFGIKIYKIVKMDTEERREFLVTYLMGLVAAAEKAIGSGHGIEKLQLVEEYFSTKSPVVYKIVLKFLGKENFRDFVEYALAQVKENFKQ